MSEGDCTADYPARILVVDDEPQNRQLLKVMLAPEGFVILTAASGEEALAIVARESLDLILLDVMMPGMDGYEVTRAIKADVSTRSIPVIMITALDDTGLSESEPRAAVGAISSATPTAIRSV